MLPRAAGLQRRPVSIWATAVTGPRFCLRAFILARQHTDTKPSNRRFLASKIETNVGAKGVVADATETIAHIHGTLPSTATPRSLDTYKTEYSGPLAPTYKRLKIFSLASLSLTAALSPFMFIIESNLPMSARASLAGMALTASGISTLLVDWCGKPYVETLRHYLPDEKGIGGLEMITTSILLRKRITRVYDVDFLVETERPFAKWELAKTVSFPPPKDGAEAARKAGDPGQEETVAKTVSMDGKVLGSWIVKWDEGGVGRCRPVGQIVR